MRLSAFTATPRYGSTAPLNTSQKTRYLYWFSFSCGKYRGSVNCFLSPRQERDRSFVRCERPGEANELLGHDMRVGNEGEVTAIGQQLPAPERQATGEPLPTLRGYEKVTVPGEDASRDRHAAEAARKV